ncbi:MAG: pyridoxine 4-dehydrogenase, partial [Actinomycetota bacterium]|nr:pyridoxine 4-dehydrogenase [Actinomycetota bacterium]
GELKLLQDQGKIRHIGISEVSVDDLVAAGEIATIVSVQNLFNLADRIAEPLLDYATNHNIAFIPWWPLATGGLAAEGSVLDELAKRRDASPSQLALAWLLKRSAVMLPIPGTSSVAHLEENLHGAEVTLTEEEFEQLNNMVYPAVQRPE